MKRLIFNVDETTMDNSRRASLMEGIKSDEKDIVMDVKTVSNLVDYVKDRDKQGNVKLTLIF